MRGREFIMKDGYSFHADYDDCVREYEHMYATYARIFDRCGLTFRAVEADTGAIGGSMSHEFQVLAESGEDLIVSCNACDYAANVEKGETRVVGGAAFAASDLEEVATPNARTIDEVTALMAEPAERFIKTLIFVADDAGVAALVRGDDQLSEAKLATALGAGVVRLADDGEIEELTGGPQGFSGPQGLAERGLRVVADLRLEGVTGMIAGANKKDAHVVGLEHGRDFSAASFHDLRAARAGDPCGRCETGELEQHRGIEVGQVFYLGTKYSKALSATVLDTDGNDVVMEMGCYGIGITRTMAAAIEQNHDDNGIVWPVALAPFEVVIVPVKWNDDLSREASERLYRELLDAGVEVVLDDRDERAGVKFADADLIGYPFRVTIGPRGLKTGTVEFKTRAESDASEISLDTAAATVAAAVKEARGR